MGLLNKLKDKFKKSAPINETYEEVPNEPSTETVDQNSASNSLLQWEYINEDAKTAFHQGYDTTRLLVNPTPLYVSGNYVYDCHISWYGQNDCADVTDPVTGKLCSRREIDYSHVLAQVDLNLLQTDYNYYTTVMRDLINKKIVDEYLEAGLTDCPNIPCGLYIGGIDLDKNKNYFRFFDPTIGQASHNSVEMQNMRAQKRQMENMSRQATIKSKEAQIAQLQNDIANLEYGDGAR